MHKVKIKKELRMDLNTADKTNYNYNVLMLIPPA